MNLVEAETEQSVVIKWRSRSSATFMLVSTQWRELLASVWNDNQTHECEKIDERNL